MKLTKFTHACVRLEKDGQALVLDPGTFSETGQALDGAGAVLITHEHGDHVDVPAVVAALQGNDALQVFAPAGVAAKLAVRSAVSGRRGSMPWTRARRSAPPDSTCGPSAGSTR